MGVCASKEILLGIPWISGICARGVGIGQYDLLTLQCDVSFYPTYKALGFWRQELRPRVWVLWGLIFRTLDDLCIHGGCVWGPLDGWKCASRRLI